MDVVGSGMEKSLSSRFDVWEYRRESEKSDTLCHKNAGGPNPDSRVEVELELDVIRACKEEFIDLVSRDSAIKVANMSIEVGEIIS
jgi:hypothetical protein